MSFDYEGQFDSEETMRLVNLANHYNICDKCLHYTFCNLNKSRPRWWFCKNCYDELPESEKYDNLEWEIK